MGGGNRLFSLDGLCADGWGIAVGDATMSVAELGERAALKLALVMSRGQWIVLRPEDVQAALQFVGGRQERGEAPAAELVHFDRWWNPAVEDPAARARDPVARGCPGRRMNGWSDWRDWEPSRPLPVDAGIAARSKRGAIGETWWSQRFVELLEYFGVGSRLARGRNYARRGQVIELEVEPGVVLAKGRARATRPTGYGSAAKR